jgi:hypothetical protein
MLMREGAAQKHAVSSADGERPGFLCRQQAQAGADGWCRWVLQVLLGKGASASDAGRVVARGLFYDGKKAAWKGMKMK